ncbi:dual oxidase maturation factor 2-like [Panonychus citri]|uniref:dual oxidase maturation factor 2-like n=1 Tax=Panonychus citri TaxID=50023 RepID=UPI0023071D91|nr:dual oxidase maturation factor 2-like [Panonychus citri]
MSSESGWFDAFRPSGGPPLYLDPNRTSSSIDSKIFFILLTFTTAEIAFLLVLPGIRKEKISTFIIVSLSLFIGCTITVAHCGSSWHIAETSISSAYKAFTKDKIFADVGVYIGLKSVNITLKAKKLYHKNAENIDYNERFYWIGATEMKQEYRSALEKGLPYPILTILEYLSKGDEGFCWGRKYRLAGYYGSTLLNMAFCLWLLMIVLLCAVPRYGIYALQSTGALMLCTNAIYSLLLPPNPLQIKFPEDVTLHFSYGWSYWLVLGAGLSALTIGSIIVLIDILFPNKFSTILEVDYDTPYRYFVGNDAHLFGGLANNNGTSHSHNNGHNHQVASMTNSASTESTCCGNNTTIRAGTNILPLQSQPCSSSGSSVRGKLSSSSISSISIKSPVSKQKSDASVCTTESYPVTRTHTNNSSLIVSTTRAIIEKQGQDNKAFDHEDNNKNIKCDDNSVKKSNLHQSSSSTTTSTASTSSTSAGNHDEISTELVHGKRAVSLSNFGRFTARQQQQQQQQQKASSKSRANCTKSNNTFPSTHL